MENTKIKAQTADGKECKFSEAHVEVAEHGQGMDTGTGIQMEKANRTEEADFGGLTPPDAPPAQAEAIPGAGGLLSGPPSFDPQESGSESEQSALERSIGLKGEEVLKSSECKHALANIAVDHQLVSEGSGGAITLPENQCLPVLDVMHPVTELCCDNTSQQAAGERTPRSTGIPDEQPVTEASVVKVSAPLCRTGQSLVGVKEEAGFLCTTEINMERADGEKMQCGKGHIEAEKFGQRMGNEPGLQIEGAQTKQVDFGGLAARDEPSTLAETISEALRLLPDAMIIPTPSFSNYEKYESESRHATSDSRSSFKEEEGVEVSYDMHTPLNTVVYKELAANGNDAAVMLTENQSNPIPGTELAVDLTYRLGAGERNYCPPGSFDDQPAKDIRTLSVLPPLCRSDLSLMELERVTHFRHANEMNWKMTGAGDERVQRSDFEGGEYDDGIANGPAVKMGEPAGTKEGYFEVLAASDVTGTQSETLSEVQRPFPEPQIISVPRSSHSEEGGLESERVAVASTSQCEEEKEACEKNCHQSQSSDDQPAELGGVNTVSPPLCRTGQSLKDMEREPDFPHASEMMTDGEKVECGEDHVKVEEFGQQMDNATGLPMREGTQTKETDLGLTTVDSNSTQGETISEAQRLLPDPVVIPVTCILDSQECKSQSRQGALESTQSFKEENGVKASHDIHTSMENQVAANKNRGAMMFRENHGLPKLDKKLPVMELTADSLCEQGAGERTFCPLGRSDGHSAKEQIAMTVSPTFCRTGQPLEDEKSEADLAHTTTPSQLSFEGTSRSHTQGTDVTNEKCSGKTQTSEALKWAKTPIGTRMNTYLGFLEVDKDIESLPAINYPTSEIKFLESMVSSLPPIKPDDSPEACHTPVPILPNLEHPKTEDTATKEQLPQNVEIKIMKKGTKKTVMPTEAVSLPQGWDAGPTCSDKQNNLCSLTQGNKAPEKRHVGKFNKYKNERNNQKINREIKDNSVDFGVEVAINQKRSATVLDSPAPECQPFEKCKKPKRKKLKTEASEAGNQAVDSIDVNPEDKLESLMDGGAVASVSNARNGVKTAEEPCQALTDGPLFETSVQCAAQPSVGSVAVNIEDGNKLIDLCPNYSNLTEYIETASKSTKIAQRVQGEKVKKTKAMGKKGALTKLVAEEECTEVGAASVSTVEDELEIHCKNETEMQTSRQASLAQEKASPVCLQENENISSPVDICHHNSQIHKTRKGRGAKRLKWLPLKTHVRKLSSTGSEVTIDSSPVLEENLHQPPAALTTCNDMESSQFQKSPCRKRTAKKNQKKSRALLKDLGSQETCLLIGKENGSANGGTVAAASNASAPNDTVPHDKKKCKSRKNKLGKNDAQKNLHIVSTDNSDSSEPQNQMTLGLTPEVKSEGILQTFSTKSRKRKCKNSKLISKVSPFTSIEHNENMENMPEIKIPEPACSFLTPQPGGGEVSSTEVDRKAHDNLRKQLKEQKVEAAAVASKKEGHLSPGERLEEFKVSECIGKSKKNLGQQYKKKTLLKMENQTKMAKERKKNERDGSSTELGNDVVTLHIKSRVPQRSKVKKINKKLKQPLRSPVGNLTAVENKDKYLPNDQNLPTFPASSTDPLLVQKGKISSSPAGFSGPETPNVIETFQILKRTPKRQSRPLKTKMKSQGINLKGKGKEPLLTVYKGVQEEKSPSPTSVGVIKQQTHYHGKKIKGQIESIQKSIQISDTGLGSPQQLSHSVPQQAVVSSTEIKNNSVGTSSLSLKKNLKKPKKSKSTSTIIPKGLMERTKNETDVMLLDPTSPVIPQQARRKVNVVPPVSKRGHKKMKKLKNKVIGSTSKVGEILEADATSARPKTGGTVKKTRRKTSQLCMKKKPKIKMAKVFAVEQGSTDLSNEQKLENQVNPQKVKKCRVKKVSKKVKTGPVGRFSRRRRITSVDKVEPHCTPSSHKSILPAVSDSTRRLNFPKQGITPVSAVSLLSNKPRYVDDGKPLKRGKTQKKKGKICKRKGKGCRKQISSVHESHVGASPVRTSTGTVGLISNGGITHKLHEHDHSLKNDLQEEAAVIKDNSQENVIENLSVQGSSHVPLQALVQPTEMKSSSTRTIERLSVRKKTKKSRRPKCKISPEVMFASVEHGAKITQDGDDNLIPKQSEDETNTQAGNGTQCHIKKRKVAKGDTMTQNLTLAETNIVKHGLGILGGAVTKVKKRGRPFSKKTLAKMAKQLRFAEEQGSNVSEMAVINTIENHGQPQDFSNNQPQACIQKKKRKKIKFVSPLTPVAHLRRYSRACKVTTDYTLDKIKDRLEYNLKLSSSPHVGDVLPSFPAMEIKKEILGSVESDRTLGTESPIASTNAAPSEMQSQPHGHSGIKTLESNTVLNSSGDMKAEEDAELSSSLSQDPGLSQSSLEIVEFNGTDVVTKKPLRSTGKRRSGKKRKRTWWDERGKAKRLLGRTLGTAVETSHDEGRLAPALEEQIPHKMYTPVPKLLNPGQGILNTYSDTKVNKEQLHCFHSEKTDCDVAAGEGQLVNGENDTSEDGEATGKLKIKNEELQETEGHKDQNIALECCQNFYPNACNSVDDCETVGKVPQKSEKEMEGGITASTSTLTSEDPNLSPKPSRMKTPELSTGLNYTEDIKVHEETATFTTLLSSDASMNPSFHNVLELDITNSVPKNPLKSIGRKRSGKKRRRSWWDERGKVKRLISTSLEAAVEMSHHGGLEPAIGEQRLDVQMCNADSKLQIHKKYSDSRFVGGQVFCLNSEKTDSGISAGKSPLMNGENDGSVDCKVLAKVSMENEELKNCEVHENQNITSKSSQDSKIDCSSMADNETVAKLPQNSGKEMEEVINASIHSVPTELQNISQEHSSMQTLELGTELNSTKDNKVHEEAATFTTVLPLDPGMSPSFHKVFEPPDSNVVTKKPRKSVGRKRRGKMRRRTWWDERGKAKHLGLTTLEDAVETSYDGGGVELALREQIPEKQIYSAELELQALEKGIKENCSDSDVHRGPLHCLISEKTDFDMSVGESSVVNGDNDGSDDRESAAQMNITTEELKNLDVHKDQEVAPVFSQNSALSKHSCDSTRNAGTVGKLPKTFEKVMEEERNASTNTSPSEDQNLSQEPCIKTLELSTKQNCTEDTKILEDTTTSSTLPSLDPGMIPSFDNVVEYNIADVVTKTPCKSIGRRRNGKKRRRTWWDERGKVKGLLKMHNSKNKIQEGLAASLLSQGNLAALSKEKQNTVEDLRPAAGLSNAQGRFKRSRHQKSKAGTELRVLRNRNRERIEPDARGANFKPVDESESECVVPHAALQSKIEHTGNLDIEQNPLESESLAWKNAPEETLSATISNPGMEDLEGCTEIEEQSASIKDAQQGQLGIDMDDPAFSNAGSASPSFFKPADSQDSSIPQQSGYETFGTDTVVGGAEDIIRKSKKVKEEIVNVKSTSGEPRETDNVLKMPQTGRAINNVKGKRGRPFKKKTLARKARNVPLIEENCSEIAAISQPENYGESPEMSFHQPVACKQAKRTKKVKLISPPTTQLRRYSRACKFTTDYPFDKIKGNLEHNINYSLVTHSSDTLPPYPPVDLKQEITKSVETERTLETNAQIVSSNNAPLREQNSAPEHASLKTLASSTKLNSSEGIKVLEETTSFTKLSPLHPSKDPSCGVGLNSSSVALKNPWKSIGRKRSGRKRKRSWWDERGKAKKLLNTALGPVLVTSHNQGRREPDSEEKVTDYQMGSSETKLLVLGQEVCEKYSDSVISGGQLLDFHSESTDCVISAGEGPFDYGENNSSHEAITKVNCRSQESSDLAISTEQDAAHAFGNNVTVLPNSCSSKGERETVDEFLPKKPEKENDETSSSGKIENEILPLSNKKEYGKLEFDVISTEAESLAGAKNPNVITKNNSSTALLNNSFSDDSQVFAEVEEKSVRDEQGHNMGIQMNNLPLLHTLQSSVSGYVVSKGAEDLLNNSVTGDACVVSKDAQKDDLCSEMEGSHFTETYSPQSSETRNCEHEDRQKLDEKRRNGKVQLLEDAEDGVRNNREMDAVEMTEEPILTANPPELQVSACLTVKNKFPAKCHFCGRAFRHITAYINHRRIHTGEKPHICQECGRTFTQLSHLNIHRKAHKLPGCLQCPLCTRKFSVRDKLLSHFLTHTDYLSRKNMIGESVRHSAGTQVKINNHLLKSSFSMQNVKPFQCSDCGKYFHYGASLRWHTCNRREKPFSCSVCDKAFNKACKLSDHEKIHWPVKPFACSICGKGFRKLGALKMHSRTHTGETPFTCAHCGDAFLLLSSLRKHQSSKLCLSEEMSERGSNGCVDDLVALQSLVGQGNASASFQCLVCRKSFSELAEYSRHLLTHTDIQPSVCDACGQKFSKSSDLHAHRQICRILSGRESLKRSSVSNEPQLHHSHPDQSPEHFQTIGHKSEESKCTHPLENELQTSGSLLQKGSQSAELLEMHPTSRAASSVRALASRSVRSCHELFKSPWRFKAHMWTSAPRYSYTCGRCGKVLENWNKYWLHQRVHWQKPGGFYCPRCGKKFHFHGLYKEHMLEHAKQNPYACPVCPVAFADKESLMDHQEEAHKACKTQKCPTCGKSFINLRNMEKHKLLHKVVHPRRRSFLRSSVPPSLLATNSSYLPLPDKPAEVISLHRCEECSVTFSSLDFLAIHQLCHPTRDLNNEEDREILVGSLSVEHQRLPQSPSSPTPLLSSSPRDTGAQPASLYAYQHPDDLYVYPTPSTSFPPPVLPYITNVFSYRNISQTNTSPVTAPEPFSWCDYNRFPVDNLQVLSEHLYAAPPPVSSSAAGPPEHPPRPHPDKLSGHSPRVHASPIAQVHEVQFICSEDLARTFFNGPFSFVKLRNKAELEESLECAECRTEFGAIEELYEHYIEHARGEL